MPPPTRERAAPTLPDRPVSRKNEAPPLAVGLRELLQQQDEAETPPPAALLLEPPTVEAFCIPE